LSATSADNADIANTLQLRDVANLPWQPILGLYISCKWTLARITTWVFRIKDGLFAVNPASVGRFLWLRSCGVRIRNCRRRPTVRLGIDTLIANILVLFAFMTSSTMSPKNQ